MSGLAQVFWSVFFRIAWTKNHAVCQKEKNTGPGSFYDGARRFRPKIIRHRPAQVVALLTPFVNISVNFLLFLEGEAMNKLLYRIMAPLIHKIINIHPCFLVKVYKLKLVLSMKQNLACLGGLLAAQGMGSPNSAGITLPRLLLCAARGRAKARHWARGDA